MSSATPRLTRPAFDTSMPNTDIVLVILARLGGSSRLVDIEDIAEAAWKSVPARFSWPRHQQYPDLDAVDVTLRAAKKNDGHVTGSKKDGWMLTPSGLGRVEQREQEVDTFIASFGNAGRTENRRERGGLDSTTMRRLDQLRSSRAAVKHRTGHPDEITVYDFLDFFGINQYMPDRKYATNRQAIENLIRDEPELVATTKYLHERFGSTYKALLEQGKDMTHGIA